MWVWVVVSLSLPAYQLEADTLAAAWGTWVVGMDEVEDQAEDQCRRRGDAYPPKTKGSVQILLALASRAEVSVPVSLAHASRVKVSGPVAVQVAPHFGNPVLWWVWHSWHSEEFDVDVPQQLHVALP